MLKPRSLLLALASICAVSASFAVQPQTIDDGRAGDGAGLRFVRIATFPVFRNRKNPAEETVAEIVAAGSHGKVLVYTDGENGALGFVDISNPARPQPGGTVTIGGEPTSVAVNGGYALAVTDTSETTDGPSGALVVVSMDSREIVARRPLGGQPDAIAISPDGRYAAIAIENERNEDVDDGAMPQMPAGWLAVVRLTGAPSQWRIDRVDLRGLAKRFPQDPEPEYVAINSDNIAAVTLQENNHVVLVDLEAAEVIGDFSAGTADLKQVDAHTDGRIVADDRIENVRREPDGIAWVGNGLLATADEGDLVGGSRGFTLFTRQGDVRYTAGNALEQTAIRLGHFPESEAGEAGIEPENVAFAHYGDTALLFVGAEEASLAYVYRIDAGGKPHFIQALPTGAGPEGLLALPARGLFVVAAEEDDPGDGVRSSLSIYRLAGEAGYPTLVSADNAKGLAISWGALSALAVDPAQSHVAWTVNDSAYAVTHIYRLDLAATPVRITEAIVVTDGNGVLAASYPKRVDDQGRVHLDAEGIDTRPGGGFWIASEGDGAVRGADKPVNSPNLLLAVSAQGVIEQVVDLPETVADQQMDHGFEGVALVDTPAGEVLYVAFQGPWAGDPAGYARIGRYDVIADSWSFAYYPLANSSTSYIGLSDLANLGHGRLAVIERDNQAGAKAKIKRLYRFGIDDAAFRPPGVSPGVLDKTLVLDLMPAMRAPGGVVLEKVEGLAVIGDDALVVTDNDGVANAYGETQFMRLDTAL